MCLVQKSIASLLSAFDSMLVFIYGVEIRSFSWFKIWYATVATHFLFYNTLCIVTLTSKELLEVVLLYNRREAIIVLNWILSILLVLFLLNKKRCCFLSAQVFNSKGFGLYNLENKNWVLLSKKDIPFVLHVEAVPLNWLTM